MSKHLVDIDEKALSAARAQLGTVTIKDTMVGLAHGTFQEEKENGIRTSMLFPGLTDTPIVLKRPVPTPPEVMAKSLQPQDVADACLLVASLPARVYVPELIMLPAGLA